MEGTRKVIEYISDVSNALKQIKTLEQANKQMAKVMGKDFVKAIKVIETNLTKMKDVKIIDKAGTEKTVKVISELGTKIKLASGEFIQFNQALTDTDKKNAQVARSVKVLTGESARLEREAKKLAKETTAAAVAAAKLKKEQNPLIGKSSQLKTNFSNLNNVQRMFSKELKGVGSVSKIVGKNITEISGNTAKAGIVVKTANGKFVQLSETIKKMPNGTQKVTRSMKDVSGQFKKTAVSSAKLDKNTVGLGDNLKRLASRAALTIPVWLLLRGAVMGTIRTFKDGISAIAEFDKTLQKAKRNMQGTVTEIARNFQFLKKEVLALSLKTGVSVEDITTAFQRFATTGQDFETSIGGATASVKLATAEFGDTKQVADALARTYKILGDSIDENIDKQDKLTYIAALIDELWKTNAFDVNELGRALERFASTAKITNISMEDSVKLMATLHSGTILAQRGGRLLGSAMTRLFSDMDKVQKVLGIKVNPELDTTVDVLLKVIDAIADLRKQGKLQGVIETSEALRNLFNLRGKIPIETMAAMRDLLRENFEVIPDINKFNKEFEKVTETTGVLVDRFHNANKEIGKALVTGVVGGENFDESLKKIVESLVGLIDVAETTGNVLRIAFTTIAPWMWEPAFDNYMKNLNEVISASTVVAASAGAGVSEQYIKALKGGLKKKELQDLFIQLTTFGAENLMIDETVFKGMVTGVKKLMEELTEEVEKGPKVDVTGRLQSRELFLEKEKYLKKELKILGIEDLEIEQKLLKLRENSGLFIDKEISKQKRLIKNLKVINALQKHQEIAKILRSSELGRLKLLGASNSELIKAEQLLINELLISEKSTDELKRKKREQIAVTQESKKEKEIMISFQLDLLKMRGATNRQLIESRREMENMYGINQGRLGQINHELNLEKEITREKLGQVNLSSESVKLFQVAQKYGFRAARSIAQLLREQVSIGAFEAGGTYSSFMPALKEFFKTELTQRKAAAFFKWQGLGIPIKEKVAMEEFRPRAVEARLETLKLPKIETKIENVKIELKKALSKEDLSGQILDDLATALKENVIIKESVESIIENY